MATGGVLGYNGYVYVKSGGGVWQAVDGSQDYKIIIDGLDYKTVKIGNQIWMAENLQMNITGSRWVNDDEATYGRKGKNYGKVYKWDHAMEAAEKVSGWHLPSSTEWITLRTFLGGQNQAGYVLKSKTSWKDNGNGSDAYGFNALPTGYSGGLSFIGEQTHFWSSTETKQQYTNDSARSYRLDYNKSSLLAESQYKNGTGVGWCWVRLIKDE